MDDVELLNRGVGDDAHPAGKGVIQPRTLRPGARRGEIDSRIRKVLWEHPRGLTVDEVGRALPLSRSSTARHLDALVRKGEIHFQTYGKTRVFTLPRRASLASSLNRPSPLILVLSADLRVLDVNDPLLSVFGLRREDLVGRRIGDTPFAAHAGERLLGEIRRGPGGRAGITEFDTLVGNAQYSFRAWITPLSSAGRAGGVVLSLEDITTTALHRRRLGEVMDKKALSLLSSRPSLLEEILERRREDERREIMETSLDRAAVPALWVGRDGRFLRANHAATLILGYQEEELARMAFSDVDTGHPPGTWDALWEDLKKRSGTSFESRIRTKTGETLQVDVSASHLNHRDQEFGLLLVRDITRQKGEEGALRASEATLRAFLDANPDPSFLIDRVGRLLLANRAAADLLGTVDSPPAPGTPVLDAPVWQAGGAREAFGEVLEGRRSRILDWEIEGRHLHTVLAPLLDPSGEVDRVAIFARDLTDRKRVEDSLRYANEKLNLLTAVTRHDVLNDIAALGMYLELPDTGAALGPGSKMAGRLHLLVQSLRRKMEFTRDYADLGMKMPGWEDVGGCVERAVATLEHGSLRVNLDLPALEIYADPLFERVIANLVDNTLRHGEHASCIGFRARVEGDSCTLIVEDDGVGIPSGMKEPIFRPGYGRHTGFGLFLVREILGITGMSISETGEPGRGAKFEIRIPSGGFRIRDESGGTHGDARIPV